MNGGSSTCFQSHNVGLQSPVFVIGFGVTTIVTSVHMVAWTRRCYEQHVRGKMHPYRRLCKKTYAVFEQQRSCTDVAHMLALIKQGKQLFYSVALMHVCQISNGNARCAMCADGDAYGNRRPQNETPDSFPLLSRIPNVSDMTSEYEALVESKLHVGIAPCGAPRAPAPSSRPQSTPSATQIIIVTRALFSRSSLPR